MTPSDSTAAIERVWAKVLDDPRAALEHELDPSDLNTLLIDVARTRAGRATPARLMKRWHDDRYVQPAASDPRQVWRVEGRLWDLLPDQFTRIDLSPVTPLGTCSATAVVDQHRVISTNRASEVVSDSTNVLALEAASRRKRNPARAVHLAACHRVIRAQPFHGEGLFQHFRIFALLSSDRDRGSGSTEAGMLIAHLRFWLQAVTDLVPGTPTRAEFTSFDSSVLRERFHDTVSSSLLPLPESVSVQEDRTRRSAGGYYTSGAVRLVVEGHRNIGEIGDGGFTDWTAKLMADAKERCLISCIATERLTAVAGAPTS